MYTTHFPSRRLGYWFIGRLSGWEWDDQRCCHTRALWRWQQRQAQSWHQNYEEQESDCRYWRILGASPSSERWRHSMLSMPLLQASVIFSHNKFFSDHHREGNKDQVKVDQPTTLRRHMAAYHVVCTDIYWHVHWFYLPTRADTASGVK